MRKSYKYFKEDDKIISIKRKNHFRIYRGSLGDKPELLKIYTFRRYVTWSDNKTNKPYKIDYGLMMVKNDDLLYDGREFISQTEYRGIQLKKLKRKMFFKRLFGK
jgi:hypothetical protein